MKRIVFIGSHLGYSLDRTALGGGAMVGLQLARRWARSGEFELTVLGSGPVSPGPEVDYQRLPTASLRDLPHEEGLIRLSEFGYARFCREFEAAAAGALRGVRDRNPPEDTCVVLNDISESPDMSRIAAMGYPMVSVWHVDVVDFFNKMYFRNWVRPERLTRAFDRARDWGLGWAVPDLLKLVFEKQRQAVLLAGRLVLPSRRMGETVLRCYRHMEGRGNGAGAMRPLKERLLILPWGGWQEEVPEGEVRAQAGRLKARYKIGPETRVLMTLSRISPEKGLMPLVEALRILESSPARPAQDLCLLLCGEPAFMRGRPYARRLKRAAGRLKAYRVVFPGHLSPAAKQAHFRLAELFVSPSIHESYGLTIVEALRAGLPVLASDHSGVDEILEPAFSRVVSLDGRAGLWGDRRGGLPGRLAEGLVGMLKDPAALKAMGDRARAAAGRMAFDSAARTLAEAALALVP